MNHYSDRSAAVALADSLHRIRKLAQGGTWNMGRYDEQRLDEEIADLGEAVDLAPQVLEVVPHVLRSAQLFDADLRPKCVEVAEDAFGVGLRVLI